MYEITVESVFAAAHAIRLPDGSLEPTHGHNWPVKVTVSAAELDDIETVCDFHLLQGLLADALAPWQNNDLNKCEPFTDGKGGLTINPTAERVAQVIAEKLAPNLPGNCTLVSVSVGEAPGCTAVYMSRSACDSPKSASPIVERKRDLFDVRDMLIEYKQIYCKTHQVRSTGPPFPISGHDIIHRAIDYGIGACNSAQLLIDNNNLIYAGPVLRPFFELAVKVMWCRQVEDGWQVLVRNFAKETDKAAQRHFDDIGESPISEDAKQALHALINYGKNDVPNLDQMLKNIKAKQTGEELIKSIDETYAVFFKGSLHQLSHANLNYLSFTSTEGDQFRLVRSARRSALWLINASHDYIDMTAEDMSDFVSRYVDGFKV